MPEQTPASPHSPVATCGMTSAEALQAESLQEGMVRLRLDLAYDGTDFSGWAYQPGLRTVCGTLQDALSLILRVPVHLTVAGRTDAGVHASGQVAHCDIPREALNQRSLDGNPRNLVRRLARLLPADVRVHALDFAKPGFDARFSALRRHYRYRMTFHPRGAQPVRARDTGEWTRPIDLDKAQAAAAMLVGLKDFGSFCKTRPFATTIRDLQELRIEPALGDPGDLDTVNIFVTADAFCWNMVRCLVGCLCTVGDGRRDLDWVQMLLDDPSREHGVPLAQGRGLNLIGVDYPADAELLTRQLTTRDVRVLETPETQPDTANDD